MALWGESADVEEDSLCFTGSKEKQGAGWRDWMRFGWPKVNHWKTNSDLCFVRILTG